jgi:DtxR family transcriptional regulator, Mn-dependent transcriptional regulator
VSDLVSTLLWIGAAVVAAGALLIALRAAIRGVARGCRTRRRVVLEDGLKHLYHCEYAGRPLSIENLSATLHIPPRQAADVLSRLESLGLVQSKDGTPRLTPEGRREALRVVRFHRVLERYLAERTGVDETHWHAEADRREHRLAADQIEKLAAEMGDPRFDPHGSPIPTIGGDLAPGEPLLGLAPGQHAVVVHVDDQPEAVYAQLVAQRLTTGAPVRVMESTAERLRVETLGEEHVLAPLLAAAVWVRRLAAAPPGPETWRRLSELAIGQKARVVGISPACRGPQRRRLLDLGLVPGTVVRAELPSPSGDPTGYRIRGAVIALRRSQADLIRIEECQRLGGMASLASPCSDEEHAHASESMPPQRIQPLEDGDAR